MIYNHTYGMTNLCCHGKIHIGRQVDELMPRVDRSDQMGDPTVMKNGSGRSMAWSNPGPGTFASGIDNVRMIE